MNRMSGSGGGVLKDLDLKERGKTLHLGDKRKPFLNQLKKDVKVIYHLINQSNIAVIHSITGWLICCFFLLLVSGIA